MLTFLYALNVFFLLLGVLGRRARSDESRFAVVFLQILFFLPLLSFEYQYLTLNMTPESSILVLFSEVIFTLITLSLSTHLKSITTETIRESTFKTVLASINALLFAAIAFYLIDRSSISDISNQVLSFKIYSPVYFSAVCLITSVIYTAWRIEQFWRFLNTAQRREYNFFIIGMFLTCGIMAWSTSYRITYLTINADHLQLLSFSVFLGWALIIYAVFKYKLLNRKVFVSRKVIYSFIIPFVLATYLVGFGILSIIMRSFDLEFSFALKWLILVIGFVLTGLFSVSGKIRSRIHFFISTNFYVNKYEYRDEWLALSQNLHGAINETDVVGALQQVLSDSLYTTEIFIWIGDSTKGYKLVSSPENILQVNHHGIDSTDPLVDYIETNSHFNLNKREPDLSWKKIAKKKRVFIDSLNLLLITPISIGNHLTGFIGLGPEYTGGQYSYDDFDLLSVLGSQTASALLAIRMSEGLANSREQRAWDRLSAFVLHDIKNAATMLSMLQSNAPAHIHKPEFQQDMLELVDDAIKRMDRVEQRLATLKDEITPSFQIVQLNTFLKNCCNNLSNKLGSMEINIECEETIKVNTDPDLLFSVMENLLLNSYEEKNNAVVQINTKNNENNEWAVIEFLDNGPGIVEGLLPDRLFEPFQTTKESGSGIGLWQVKNVISSIGGNISAENTTDTGATFIIELPK